MLQHLQSLSERQFPFPFEHPKIHCALVNAKRPLCCIYIRFIYTIYICDLYTIYIYYLYIRYIYDSRSTVAVVSRVWCAYSCCNHNFHIPAIRTKNTRARTHTHTHTRTGTLNLPLNPAKKKMHVQSLQILSIPSVVGSEAWTHDFCWGCGFKSQRLT